MTTIADALQVARLIIDSSEARLLLRHVLGCTATHVEAHCDDELELSVESKFVGLVERRKCGDPIAYLTGAREFYGREFHVAPGVLIPRAETELIVDVVLERHSRERGNPVPLRILDLGTGSGCLAITLALELPHASVIAVDLSPDALAIARQNAQRHRANVRWLESDWFSSLRGEQFDLIVSNPPYVAASDPHLTQGDLRYEPSCALASGADGLDAIRTIIACARDYLGPDGYLWIEHGYDQDKAVRALLESHGYAAIEQHRDLAAIVRVSGGQRDSE